MLPLRFFVELGLELEGEAPMEGPWVDCVNGLNGVRVGAVPDSYRLYYVRGPEGIIVAWPSSSANSSSRPTATSRNDPLDGPRK